MPSTVVVTGASAGVGRATAVAFARRGAAVVLLARGIARLEAAVAECERAGGRALAVPTDVADAAAVEAAAERAERELGPIDVWVNNATATVFAPIADTTPAELARATAVTYLGAVHGTMAALQRMRARDRGTIVQVGSALAYRGIPFQAAYCAAKHALRGFTDALRCELLEADSSIRVTMVHLPALNTPQFEWSRAKLPNEPQPVPPIYAPEVAADAIVWAADKRPRDVKVGAPTVTTIFGQWLAPSFADRFLARTGRSSQQTDVPLPGVREGNLFEPVPLDRGAHGPFRSQERKRSWTLEARQHHLAWLVDPLAVAWHGIGLLGQWIKQGHGRR